MANVNLDFKKSDEAYQRILLHNLPEIIKYFNSLGTHDPEKLEEIRNRITMIKKQQGDLKQEKANITQMYRQCVFGDENSDISPLRDDNGLVDDYTETYNNALTQERQLGQQLQEIYNDPLWRNSQIKALLAQLFQKQLRINEIQESIAWQSSEAYKSISRYERNDDENETEEVYDKLLRQCKKDLDDMCKECLGYPEIVGYINIIIVNNSKQRIQNTKVSRRTK